MEEEKLIRETAVNTFYRALIDFDEFSVSAEKILSSCSYRNLLERTTTSFGQHGGAVLATCAVSLMKRSEYPKYPKIYLTVDFQQEYVAYAHRRTGTQHVWADHVMLHGEQLRRDTVIPLKIICPGNSSITLRTSLRVTSPAPAKLRLKIRQEPIPFLVHCVLVGGTPV